MRFAPLALVCALMLACGSPSTTPDETDPGTRPSNGGLALSTELRGTPVESVDEGPWTVRRLDREERDDLADGAPPPGSPRRTLSAGKIEARGGGGAVGGARAPVESEAAEPEPSTDAEMADGGDAGPASGGRRRGSPDQQGFRAGSTDDNADYAAFLEFLARWTDRSDVAGRFEPIDVRDRRHVRVLDAKERPVPAARVRIVDETADRVIWAGTTYGDGRVPFYPLVAVPAEGAIPVVAAPDGGYLVEVRTGSDSRILRWDGTGEELVVRLEGERTLEEPIRLDVVFVIDTTGSMRDEIDRIKATLLRVTGRLREMEREFDLRYGAVLYRDLDDVYVTKAHPFTGDIEGFAAALQAVGAGGGGDYAESLNQGLAEAVGGLEWRDGAAKVAFLIADAPPHMDYRGDVPYGRSIRAAVAKGIRIHAVAASGLSPLGSLVFRQVAQFTRGKFVFIEYGTPAESAARHGVRGEVKSNNLDDILFEQIREEVARWGRDS